MVFSTLFFATTPSVSATFPSGSGTSEDPYIIENVDHLQEMKDDLTAYYALGNDIDASATQTWNDNGDGGYFGFEPIGTYTNPFTGSFDGRGYKITNLYINRPSTDFVGLLGYAGSGSIVKNVGVVNVDVSGYYCVGGLVGWIGVDDSVLEIVDNCYSTGDVSGTVEIGGLVGNAIAQITNSYSACSVSCITNSAGGLIGYNYENVFKCYSTGSVNSGERAGGLIGSNVGKILNSYSTSSVSGSTDIGGLIGDTAADVPLGYLGEIDNCYSTGLVNGTSQVGGLIGRKYSGIVSNSFWDNETSGQTTSAGGAGKTTTEMMTITTFSDNSWDIVLIGDYIDEIWYIDNGNDYPRLGWEYSYPPNKPTNLLPSARQTTTDVTISCVVTDNNNNTMNVFFYDNSDNSLALDWAWIESGGTAEVIWSSLTRGNTYTFFARGQDNTGLWGENSDTQSFLVGYNLYINGNDNFTSANGVNGGGDGTASNPWIIENWIISASGADGITIQNTTDYFIVRNCLVENGIGSDYCGIYLENATNGRIENNTCSNNYIGIYLYSSSYDNLTNNTCSNSGAGIYLDSSSHDNLAGNTCENNDTGICLYSSSNDNLTGNTCENNNYGIYLVVSSDSNTIFCNRLLNSMDNNAYDDSTNYWDNGSAGNYWSDWQPPEHPDANHDNIIDTPRPIDNESNQDNYPLRNITNSLPTAPTLYTNLDNYVTDHTPEIEWTKGTDADGDTVWTFIYMDNAKLYYPATTQENHTTDNKENIGENFVVLVDGENYTYRLRSWDGCEWSASYSGNDNFRMNSKPTIVSIDVTPHSPLLTDDLLCSITNTDNENDPIADFYQWFKNGVSQPGENKNTLLATLTLKGENWLCVVTPFDGYENGENDNDSVIVANTKPTCSITAPTTDFSVTTGVGISFTCSSHDNDNDPLTFLWNFDDGGLSMIENTTHQYATIGTYTVTLRVNDGFENSAVASVTVIITSGEAPPSDESNGGWFERNVVKPLVEIVNPTKNLLFMQFLMLPIGVWILLLTGLAYAWNQKGLAASGVMVFGFLIFFGARIV